MRTQSGFSAVELLVTLFIAAAFLLAGYQLYTTIVRDSGDARQRTRASNIAYDYLRRYAASASTPLTCSPSTPVYNTPLDPVPDGLGMAVVTVQISCPNLSTLNRLKKIQATVRYTADGEEVQHAIYITTS